MSNPAVKAIVRSIHLCNRERPRVTMTIVVLVVVVVVVGLGTPAVGLCA
jgi:hypothetical protein